MSTRNLKKVQKMKAYIEQFQQEYVLSFIGKVHAFKIFRQTMLCYHRHQQDKDTVLHRGSMHFLSMHNAFAGIQVTWEAILRFLPTRTTRCTSGVEICPGWDCHISPPSVQGWRCGTQKRHNCT